MAAVGHVFLDVFREHVGLLLSDQDLAATAVARTVRWRVGRGFSMGHVLLNVFRRHVDLLPSGHKLAVKQWREFAGV